MTVAEMVAKNLTPKLRWRCIRYKVVQDGDAIWFSKRHDILTWFLDKWTKRKRPYAPFGTILIEASVKGLIIVQFTNECLGRLKDVEYKAIVPMSDPNMYKAAVATVCGLLAKRDRDMRYDDAEIRAKAKVDEIQREVAGLLNRVSRMLR